MWLYWLEVLKASVNDINKQEIEYEREGLKWENINIHCNDKSVLKYLYLRLISIVGVAQLSCPIYTMHLTK